MPVKASVYAHLTPKGIALLALIAEGIDFDDALAIVDGRFTSDGLREVSPWGRTLATMGGAACHG